MSKKQNKNEFRPRKDHHLKTWPSFFRDVRTHAKSFELRRNDRDFKTGDVLYLNEWDPELEAYSGESEKRTISHIFVGGRFGLGTGFCILSFAPTNPASLIDMEPAHYAINQHKQS